MPKRHVLHPRCALDKQSFVYLEFYGLNEPPFAITPNPRFLYYSPKHREAFNHVLYGIRERKGFVQLTGEVGSGKTTLCRAAIDELGELYSTALILNPSLETGQLLKAIAMEFGLDVQGMDKLEILSELNNYFLIENDVGRMPVVIIDEAQNLSNEVMEEVRLLSNLETDSSKLVQILLMGQPELRERINDPALRQLRQRITVRYHLEALTQSEIGQYIQHRLQVAGSKGAPYFSQPALWRIRRYTKGIPRLVNALCDKCLLAGYVNQRDRIDFNTVGRAIQELEGQ